jgi:hypothetical protein
MEGANDVGFALGNIDPIGTPENLLKIAQHSEALVYETVAALNISVHAPRMMMDQLAEASLPPSLQPQVQLRQLL